MLILFSGEIPERLSDILTFWHRLISEKIPSQDFAQQFHSACLLHQLFVQYLFPSFVFMTPPYPLCCPCLSRGFLRTHNSLSFLSSSLGKKKSQYEFVKQCMNKSFPALNTPLSKWSRDFSRTIYITVADTVFKFSCQSQNGILNHPIFLNEVSEF